MVAGSRAPAVLQFPFHGYVVLVGVAADEQHGVGGTALAGQDTGFLVHVELDAEERFIVVVTYIHDAFGAVALLAHVAGDVERRIVLDGGQCSRLDLFVGQVQVAPVDAFVGITIRGDIIDLVVFAGRIIHDHDEAIGVVVGRNDTLVEFHRGGLERLDFALGVAVAPGEFRRRLTQAEGQHAIDILEDFNLLGFESLGLGARCGHLAQVPAAGAQQFVQHAAQLGGIVGVLRLRHDNLRHDAIFLSGIVEEVPDATVGHGRLEVEFDVTVGDRTVGGGDHVLQEKIGLFELVPEEGIVVGEIEFLQIEFLHHGRAQHVHRGEHPAAAGAQLVGDAAHVAAIFEEVVDRTVLFVVVGEGLDVLVLDQGVLDGLRSGVFDKTAPDLIELGLADGLCAGEIPGKAGHDADDPNKSKGKEGLFHISRCTWCFQFLLR